MDYAIQNNCCSCNSLPLVLLVTSSPPRPPPPFLSLPLLSLPFLPHISHSLLTQDNAEYPQLDVDDVLKIDEELRRQRLRDLLQTAKEPVEASTWGSVKAVCGQCATMYFAVYTDVCRFPLCSMYLSLYCWSGFPHSLSKVSR